MNVVAMKRSEPEPEGFAEFWTIWREGPVRISDGRGKARPRYKNMVEDRGFDPRDILDGARAYVRQVNSLPAEKQQFFPLAASWLNAESFLDWCEKERKFQKYLAERNSGGNVTAIR